MMILKFSYSPSYPREVAPDHIFHITFKNKTSRWTQQKDTSDIAETVEGSPRFLLSFFACKIYQVSCHLSLSLWQPVSPGHYLLDSYLKLAASAINNETAENTCFWLSLQYIWSLGDQVDKHSLFKILSFNFLRFH